MPAAPALDKDHEFKVMLCCITVQGWPELHAVLPQNKCHKESRHICAYIKCVCGCGCFHSITVFGLPSLCLCK